MNRITVGEYVDVEAQERSGRRNSEGGRAIVVAVNLQTSFLTPPFGFALFYLKGVAPKGVTMSHI